jgi:hypothetical protein
MKTELELGIKIVENVLQYDLMPTIYYKDLDTSKKYYCLCGSPESEEVNVVEYVYGRWLQYEFLPSVNISDAWQVVEKLKLEFICKVIGLTNDHKDWFCSFTPIGLGAYGNFAYAETAPLAICLAALKTEGIKLD